jgi:hypothetical protein
MSKFTVLLLATITSASLSSFAQTKPQDAKETKAEAGTITADAKPKSVDEADEVITNRLLRASSGSLSRWSGNYNVNYNGGSLDKPMAAQRPNIVDGADALTLQYVSANIGIRYRLSTLNSLTLATGMFMSTPFNKTIKTNDPDLKSEFDKTTQVLTVNDPNLIFTNLSNIYGFQIVTTFTPTLITNSQQRSQGYRASYDISPTIMKVIGKSNLSLGAAFEWTGYTFDKPNKNLATNVWQLYPIAEYIINQTFNLRTLWGWQVYQQTRDMKWTDYTKRTVYQSFGVGISLTRDVFLYPNIQFIPSDIRADRTNIGLSAYVNTF